MGNLRLSAALADGQVRPKEIDLTVLVREVSRTRHKRMLKHREFDICEFADVRCAESDYYGETREFSAMHTIIRDEILEQHPAAEQGLTTRKLDPGALFYRTTLWGWNHA